MNKLYNKITFENDNVPSLNESNLNSISKAIDDIDDRLIDVAGLIEGSISMSYTDLEDKPSINGVTLVGNKTSSDLNISANVKYGTKSEFDAIKNTLPVGTEYIITDDYEAGGGSSGASSASNVSYDNTTSGLDADNVQDAIDEVFQSVSNGKELIADAITDKGVETSATDTFQTMATNISNISSGGGGTEIEFVGVNSSSTSHTLTGYEGKHLIIDAFNGASGAKKVNYLEPITFTNCDAKFLGNKTATAAYSFGNVYDVTNIIGDIIITLSQAARLNIYILGE